MALRARRGSFDRLLYLEKPMAEEAMPEGLLRTIFWTQLRAAMLRDGYDVPEHVTPAIAKFCRDQIDVFAELMYD